MNDLEKIKHELKHIKDSSIVDRYKAYVNISKQLVKFIREYKNIESINLCKELMNSIYELRYEMAYNKATESGSRDIELKQIWESLDSLISTNDN